MSELTLDDAIKHCLEVAEQNDAQAEKWREEGGEEWGKTTACRECAAEHRQLAEWLTELKDLREENKVLISECDRLIKEKGELLSKVSGGDVLRICQLEEHLEKAKRLLKAAVDDMSKEADCGICLHDDDGGCPIEVTACKFKWRYADEAERLLKGE